MNKTTTNQEIIELENGFYKIIETIETELNQDELIVLYQKMLLEKTKYQEQANQASLEKETREKMEKLLEEYILQGGENDAIKHGLDKSSNK
jgi:RAB protein geranylgeranyltransferase component A